MQDHTNQLTKGGSQLGLSQPVRHAVLGHRSAAQQTATRLPAMQQAAALVLVLVLQQQEERVEAFGKVWCTGKRSGKMGGKAAARWRCRRSRLALPWLHRALPLTSGATMT